MKQRLGALAGTALIILLASGASFGQSNKTGGAEERVVASVKLAPNDVARMSFTHTDVEPMWVDLRIYNAKGKVMKFERLTVLPRRTKFTEIRGFELSAARPEQAGELVATMKTNDGTTGRTFLGLQPKRVRLESQLAKDLMLLWIE